MPPKSSKVPKRSQILEEEAKKMEDVVKMLRSQIDEAKATVNQGPRWAAAAEGPIKFDSNSEFARKILSKKKSNDVDATQNPKQNQKKQEDSTSAQEAIVSKVRPPANSANGTPSQPRRKVEVIVEKQGGALWGQFSDNSLAVDYDEDGNPIGGGALWGTNQEAEALKLEMAEKMLDQKPTMIDNVPDPIPVPGGGGALWGPNPDENKEAQKFKEAVNKIRANNHIDSFPLPERPEKPNVVEVEIGGENYKPPVITEKLQPSNFTYFDMLNNRDILDGSRFVDRK